MRGKLLAVGAVALVSAAIMPASSMAELVEEQCPGPTDGGVNETAVAQTFTAMHTGTLLTGGFYIAKTAGPLFQMQIFSAGASGPAGPALGTANIADSAVANVASPGPTSPGAGIVGAFYPGVPVTAGHMYAIVLSRPGGTFVAKDRSGDPCPGSEFGIQRDGSWAVINPTHDFFFGVAIDPAFFAVKAAQLGRVITVTVPLAGTLTLGQAGLPPGVATATRGFEVLRESSATATGPGDVTLPILLNKTGKRLLRQKGKLNRTAEITYTPTGGTASTIDTPIHLKNRRRHHH